MMNTLFGSDPFYPDGFQYYADFFSEDEEQQLIAIVRDFDLHKFQFQGYVANRSVASFGYDWNFESKTLKKGRPIPGQFNWLLSRLSTTLQIPEKDFSELLLTEYTTGTVINWHRDAPPFEYIADISLGAECTMKLRPFEKEKQTRKATRSLTIERRSMYLISGEARSNWQHSIAPVKQLRYPITVRTVYKNYGRE